jgi:porin
MYAAAIAELFHRLAGLSWLAGYVSRPVVVCAAICFLLCTSAVRAQTWDKQGWDKIKAQLNEMGITPSFAYQANGLGNAAGGLVRGVMYQDNFYMQLRVDGEKAFAVPGLQLFVSELVTHGPFASEFTGDAQGVSNISSRSGFRSYEGWAQYDFLQNHLSILVGQYDLSTEFYRLQSAGLFLNSAFGTGSEMAFSGLEGPSIYPYTSIGGRIEYKATPNLSFRAAFLDGVPLYRPDGTVSPFRKGDGFLIASEVAYTDPPSRPNPLNPILLVGRFSGERPYEDKFAVGGWYYTAPFDALAQVDAQGNPLQLRDSSGAYVIVDKVVLESPDHRQQVSAFLQFGVADQQVNRFGTYIGTGIAAAGLVPGRPKDEFGVAVAIARNGYSYMVAQTQLGLPVARAETAIEVTYLAQINDWLAIQPDFQYVVHPNTDPTVKNAAVFQLRAEIAF